MSPSSITFLIGLALGVIGGILYGKLPRDKNTGGFLSW